MRKVQSLFLSLCFIFILWSPIFSQPFVTTVEDICDNPGNYANELVQVEGTVEIYIKKAATTTSHYILKGDYGEIVKVNTSSGKPNINKRYRVIGTVYIDPVTREAFISEQIRTLIKPPPPLWLVILIIALIAALIVLLVYEYRRRSKTGQTGSKTGNVSGGDHEVGQRNDLKTVKIMSPPKTMKFIPGELLITAGEDEGKSFKIAGFPTVDGSMVTIGREEVKDERAYAHIQLNDENRTVSRKQAKLIYKNNKLYIQNLSGVNNTQVNGIEMKEGEELELKSNASIRMGFIELKYIN